MPKKYLLKKVSYNKRGDKLEVKVKDFNWNVIYKMEVDVRNPEEMFKLIGDLKNLGITFPKYEKAKEIDWF